MTTTFYFLAVLSLVSGIAAMGMAVVKAEANAKRFSLVFYAASIGLIVLSAAFAVLAQSASA